MVSVRDIMSDSVPNDKWMTEDDVPDPTPLPRVPGVGVLVRPVPLRRKTAGGILLPDTVRSDMEYLNTVGRVLALGELAFRNEEIYPNGEWVKPGDYVVYTKYAGSKLMWKGVRLLLIKANTIELVVEKPEWLDAAYRE